MAYTPGYKFDVFISYAHIDNEPVLPGDDQTRWVSNLSQMLKTRLEQQLGNRNVEIHLDLADIQKHVVVDQRIEDSIANSAALVTCFSKSYLNSKACRQERESFCRAMRTRGMDREGIFLVQLDEIDRSQWPAEFENLIGYPFHQFNPESKLTRRMADPKPSAEEPAFWSALNQLRTEIGNYLESLDTPRTLPNTSAGQTPSQAGSAPTTSQPQLIEETPKHKTVLLGEPSPDLYNERLALSAFLTDQGFNVLGDSYYPRSESEYAAALGDELTRVGTFVQTLGQFPIPGPPNMPEPYEAIQIREAQQYQTPVLRWRRKDIDINALTDPRFQALIRGDDVMAMTLEDFKGYLLESLKERALAASAPKSSTSDPFILITASETDRLIAEQCREQIANSAAMGAELVGDDTPLDELLEYEEYDGVMVVHDQAPSTALEQRLRVMRRLKLKLKDQAPPCGLFAKELETLPLRFRDLILMKGEDHSALNPFVNAVLGEHSAS